MNISYCNPREASWNTHTCPSNAHYHSCHHKHSRTQTHIYSPCSILIRKTSDPIHCYCVHIPYKVLSLSNCLFFTCTSPGVFCRISVGFMPRKYESITAPITPMFLPVPHTAVFKQIPFFTIKTLQLYSLSIAMCIGFVDVHPSRDCIESSNPI